MLMAPPPYGPSEDVLGVRRARPYQMPEQPAQFGYGGGQQVQPQSAIDVGLRS